MARPFTLLAEMTSASTGEKYEIRRGHDGQTYCTCLGWRFSKLRPKTCRHLGIYNDDVMLSANTQVNRAPTTAALPIAPGQPATAAVAKFRAPTAMDRALELTRQMVVAARLTVTEAAVRTMATQLAPHVPVAAPSPAVAMVPGKVRMITFED